MRDDVAALQQALDGAGGRLGSLKPALSAEWDAYVASGGSSLMAPTDWVIEKMSSSLMTELLAPARQVTERALHGLDHLEAPPPERTQRMPWADADALAGGSDTDDELGEPGGGSLGAPGKRSCPDDELNETGTRVEDSTRAVKATAAATAAAGSSATPPPPAQEATPAELRHPVCLAAAGHARARQHTQV